MRATRFLTLFTLSGALAVFAASACSSDVEDDDDATGGGGATTTSSTTTPTGTSTGTGTGGDGNDSFEEADPIETNEDIAGVLDPIESDVDYFRFSASAGDLLYIDTLSKPEADPFSTEYPDLVITLYDQDENQIAQNDDPFLDRDTNDSELWTMVPTTGDYFITVTDCNVAFPGASCYPLEDIVNFDYYLRVNIMDPSEPSLEPDPENGDDQASAQPVAYETTGAAGEYYASILYGTFNDDSDVDVFSFTIPADLAYDHRSTITMTFVGPEGTDGCGTTNNVGMAWITDGAGTILSQIDHQLNALEAPRRMGSPIPVNVEHFMFVEHPGGGAGANDFYIAFHYPYDSNPLEQQEAANDDPATAEVITGQINETLYTYFIAGDLADENDVDHFVINGTPGGFDPATWTVAISCAGERYGSGVRGLTAELLEAAAPYTAVTGGQGTETASDSIYLPDITVPAGQSQFIVKMSSDVPSSTVMGRFYMCGYHFVPPPPAS